MEKIYISLGLNLIAIIISLIGFPKITFILLIITSLAWFIPNHIFEQNKIDN